MGRKRLAIFAKAHRPSYSMKTQKDFYLPPKSEAIELRTEGVIAHSFVSPFDERQNW